jgi:hypothetical protein
VIGKTELLATASELGLAPRVVEKDYGLGWVLAGIARDVDLAGSWLFNCGTCLKKCFFETYRFSEDLDVTVIEPAFLDKDVLLTRFKAIGIWLYDTTGIELPSDLLRFSSNRAIMPRSSRRYCISQEKGTPIARSAFLFRTVESTVRLPKPLLGG